ncbi:MAG TPA: prolipoprotein diacylglyceryl transferase [Anaeromyxobacteraceae bacterium]|nr:prolipoprotein diacylglyceryl transferase [Anaeromyxobacteraceae bacterium]
MLPVLLTLRIPAGWVPAAAALLLAAVAAARAWSLRRRAPTGERPGWAAAMWDDRAALGALAAALAGAWWAGLLSRELVLPLHGYGLMIAAGFVVAIEVARREARRWGQDAERISDLAFWVLVAALVGSRLYFVAVNWREYAGEQAWTTLGGVRVPRVLVLWEGGLVFYGGFIAAALTAFWYLRRHRLPFLAYADTLIPSVALGHVFGRLGCFAAGCCWGRISHAPLPWLVRFPPESLAYQAFAARPHGGDLLAPDRLATLPVHPTQLYEALGELGLFLALVLWVRPRKRFEGQVLASWLLAYAVLRTVVEAFRGDVERGVFAGLGVGQWTSAIVLAAGALVWVAGRRRGAAAASTSAALAA